MTRMIKSGLLDLEPETYPVHVVAFPDPSWTQHQKREHAYRRQSGQPTMRPLKRALQLTEKGRALAPKDPPYPWRPELNGLADVTSNETERLQKASVFATFRLAGALQHGPQAEARRSHATAAINAENVIPFVRTRRSDG